MANDWIEESALHFEGFSDAQITQIKIAVPLAQEAIAFAQQQQKTIDLAMAKYKDALIFAQQTEPTLEKAIAYYKQLVPVANMILTVMKGRVA
jgi:hypothetical protein